MTKRIKELLEKIVLTKEELNELLEELDYSNNGQSGINPNWVWYTVTVDGAEHDVYLERKNTSQPVERDDLL